MTRVHPFVIGRIGALAGTLMGALMSALMGVSCFSVAPLADCATQDGLYVAYHVCMPLARPPLQLERAPVGLAAGDFDGDKALNDLAVLSDPDHVVVFTGLAQDTPSRRELSFTGGTEVVQGFLATPFFDGGIHGADLIAWVPRAAPGISQIVALPNGGDNFAGEARSKPLRGVPLDSSGQPIDLIPRTCYAPNRGLALDGPLGDGINVVMVTCLPDQALAGMPAGDFRPDELPDAIAVIADSYVGGAFGAHIEADYRSLGAAQLTLFDPAGGLVDFVFAHRPAPDEDAQLAIVHASDLDTSEAVAVRPRQGSIDEVRAADLDLDGDIDLLTIHLEKAGFSIIRQQASEGSQLVFGEPEFYTLELELSDVALGDFTGDGGLDIIVAHNIDNTSLDGITIFALDREQPGGPAPYVSAKVGAVQGAIVALRTLDLDGDGGDDLAVAVRDGSRGYVNFYANRSPGEP